MSANMEQVATYIIENGMEEFRAIKVKDKNREVFNFVMKQGGFTKFRDDIIHGKYDIYFKDNAKQTDCSGLIPEVLYKEKEIYIVPEQQKLKDENNKVEYIPEEKGFHDTFLKLAESLLANQDTLIKKVDNIRIMKNAVNEYEDKIEVLKKYMVHNMKKNIRDMMYKYTAIKYRATSNTNIRRSYRDIYDIFDKYYCIEIEQLQLAYIKKLNASRVAKGLAPIEFVNANSGISKLSIIERLGLMAEFYLIVEQELGKLSINE